MGRKSLIVNLNDDEKIKKLEEMVLKRSLYSKKYYAERRQQDPEYILKKSQMIEKKQNKLTKEEKEIIAKQKITEKHHRIINKLEQLKNQNVLLKNKSKYSKINTEDYLLEINPYPSTIINSNEILEPL